MQNSKKTNKNLNRNIADCAWGNFVLKLLYKAEYAGRKVIKINPRNTSKMCSGCKNIKTDLQLNDKFMNAKSARWFWIAI